MGSGDARPPKADFEACNARRPTSASDITCADSSAEMLNVEEPPPCHSIPQIAELALIASHFSQTTARRVATTASTWTSDPAFEVDWQDDDPENPRNWPLWYKSLIIFTVAFGTLVV